MPFFWLRAAAVAADGRTIYVMAESTTTNGTQTTPLESNKHQ